MKSFINETTVLAFYQEQMDADRITFLQGKSASKKMIKKLLKDLEEFPDIHQKIQVAKELWKVLFEEAMSTINPDKRGYDKLFKYFDEYVDFEELIFATDSFYRDHTLHCLWVYFLGEYLYCNREFKKIFKYIFEDNTLIYEMEEISQMDCAKGAFSEVIEYTKPFNNIMSKSDALRCLSALSHDLGYPLKKIQKINKSIGSILPYFAINNFNEFDFSYANEQSASINTFLEGLSSDLQIDVTSMSGEENQLFTKITNQNPESTKAFDIDAIKKCTEEEIEKLRRVKPEATYLKSVSKMGRYGEDFENYEHGIMSAFILYKTLMSNKVYKYLRRENGKVGPKDMDFDLYFALNIIYSAIADHTSKAYKISSINNPSAFLILIDELEEFSRISRANQNRQYISEFCKTAIYMEDDTFCVDFLFDNNDIVNLDPERAFKGRCHRMLTLFDIPKLDSDFKLRLRCIDALKDKNIVYELALATKYAKISIDNHEKNIPKYLNSREYYTREDYSK